MMNDLALYLVYAVPAGVIWAAYFCRHRAQERLARARLGESTAARMLEPPSLHPSIDPNSCAGCGACVAACPEKGVLGIIDCKSVLVSPADCIGHGACKSACPVEAITLVFGTETRGIDIPHVGENFETNVPGLFIAGELGGMGLIRNAIEQGRQAIEEIGKQRAAREEELDVVIVGAGPAGIAATLGAKRLGLRTLTIEQESLGGTVAHYPRGKIVMTAPVDLPLYGKVKIRETTKEALLALWRDVEHKTGIQISYGERLLGIEARGSGFELSTSQRTCRARAVLLCIGRRGTPRKLGVPGEELPKVVYRLSEPEQYEGRSVLVVGGGDSALEAAVTLAEEVAGTTVALSYRNAAFSRAKPKNRERIGAAVKSGVVSLLMESQVREITAGSVRVSCDGRDREIENDAVIVCAGGILPTALLESIGIEIETKYGTV